VCGFTALAWTRFYDRLQSVLIKGGFDHFVEKLCEPYYASGPDRKSIPPGRYFKMHLIGYFEGIESECGLGWRCSDSLSLRKFLRLSLTQRVTDRSSLSRIRQRLPEVHQAVFSCVLQALTKSGLVVGERLGIDASTIVANAAMRSIVRRDTGETYQQMLERIAKDSGIKTPTREELARMDRKRKGKELSNTDWKSASDGTRGSSR
jgi:transposase